MADTTRTDYLANMTDRLGKLCSAVVDRVPDGAVVQAARAKLVGNQYTSEGRNLRRSKFTYDTNSLRERPMPQENRDLIAMAAGEYREFLEQRLQEEGRPLMQTERQYQLLLPELERQSPRAELWAIGFRKDHDEQVRDGFRSSTAEEMRKWFANQLQECAQEEFGLISAKLVFIYEDNGTQRELTSRLALVKQCADPACARLETSRHALRACDACLRVFYCNNECETADREHHRPDCQPPQ
jgi:MYND finger